MNHSILFFMPRVKDGYTRSKSVMIRLTPTEYNIVKKSSKSSRSVADYLRTVILRHEDDKKVR